MKCDFTKSAFLIMSLYFVYTFGSASVGLASEKLNKSTKASVKSDEPIRENIIQQKEKLKQNLVESEKVHQLLSSMEMRMRKIVKKKSKLTGDRMEMESALSKTIKTIELSHRNLNEARKGLAIRVQKLSRIKRDPLMTLIEQSTSPVELQKRLRYLKLLVGRDVNLVKTYLEQIRTLQVKKYEYKNRLTELKNIELKVQAEEQNYQNEMKLRSSVFTKLRKSQKAIQSQISLLRQKNELAANQFSELLSYAINPSLIEKKGMLTWPVVGEVSKEYGIEAVEDSNATIMNPGIFIRSNTENAEVTNVFPGKVVYAGLIEGLGKVLIMDHGDHFFTIYGNLSELFVQQNQKITSEAKIARVGWNQDGRNQGVYFELRHYDETYNPREWLKGSTL